MSRTSLQKYNTVKSRAKEMLIRTAHSIDELSFCIIAARPLEYRLIIVVVPGLADEAILADIKELEKWPERETVHVDSVKELWVGETVRKSFDIYTRHKNEWINSSGKRFCLAQLRKDKLSEPLLLTRGRIDDIAGCVYFIYSPGTGLVKIGKAVDIERRFREITTYSPDAELLGVIETSVPYEHESFLHKKFADLRVSGEWFEYRDRLKNYIKGRAQCQNQP